jgi:hypothetical protein
VTPQFHHWHHAPSRKASYIMTWSPGCPSAI